MFMCASIYLYMLTRLLVSDIILLFLWSRLAKVAVALALGNASVEVVVRVVATCVRSSCADADQVQFVSDDYLLPR